MQRLPTDNGTEFLASKVRDELLALGIKQRPIPPRTPPRNGKVEPVQQTLLTEFYATTTGDSPSLEEDLGVWLLDYTYRRVHGSLGKTPMQRWQALNEQTPFWEDVVDAFDPVKEAHAVEQLTLRRRKATASKSRNDVSESHRQRPSRNPYHRLSMRTVGWTANASHYRGLASS
jgi:hypothetical protein